MPRSIARLSRSPALLTGLALLSGCFGAPQLVGTDQVPNANLGWTALKDAKHEAVTMPEVDAIMEALLVEGPNPGCAVGLVKNGEIVYLRGYGDAVVDLAPNDGVDTSVPWTVGTTAPVGSISKTLTALAVMHLADHAALDPGDAVEDHIATTGPIGDLTLTELLSHAIGLGHIPIDQTQQGVYDVEHPMAHPRLAYQEYEATTQLGPGTPGYSNRGYAILGAVIDALTADPASGFGDAAGYERYVWHNVAMWSSYSLDARNMLSPALTLSWRLGDIPSYAHGYQWTGSEWDPMHAWEDPDAGSLLEGLAGPAGLWTMTIGDLARLVAALQNEQILSPWANAEMRTPRTTINGRPYGYGMWLERGGKPVLEHGGDIGPYASLFVSWPAEPATEFSLPIPQRGVALMCNGNSQSHDLGVPAELLQALVAKGGIASPTPATPATPVPAAALDGGVFAVRLRGAWVASPSNLFLPLETEDPITLAVADAGDGTLALELALPGSTVTLDDSAYRDDTIVHTPSFTATITTALGNLALADATLQASFTADAQGIAWATLDATLDARQIGGADPSETWEDLCGFVADQGTRCLPCADGQEACFAVRIEGLTGHRIPDGT